MASGSDIAEMLGKAYQEIIQDIAAKLNRQEDNMAVSVTRKENGLISASYKITGDGPYIVNLDIVKTPNSSTYTLEIKTREE